MGKIEALLDTNVVIAMRIAAQLRRYEILSDTEVPEDSDLFSRAAFERSDQTMLGDGE